MSSKRWCLVVMLLLYAAALAAPVRQITEASQLTRERVDVLRGWQVLRFGWMGPLGLTFGWYANIPLVLCAGRLLRGRSSGQLLPRVASGLAVSSLLPFGMYSGLDGMHRGLLRGPGVWLWLGVFAVLLGETEWGSRGDSPAPEISSR